MTSKSTGNGLPGAPGARPGDAGVARITTRLSTEYVLRVFQLLIDTYGDIRAGLMVHAINIANVAHLDNQTEENRQAAAPGGIFPDEMRRPITVARLAESFALPFESARRTVQRLIRTGMCKRVQGGVIVPGAIMERPENLRGAIANAGYVRKFMRDLHAAGLIDHIPAALSVAANVDATAAARLVSRRSGEYVQRTLQLLTETYGDVRTGVIVQTIIAANTSYLDTRGGEGWRYAGIDQNPPDEARRPISVGRIAESLGLPYETARRQVERLLQADICARLRGGVIVPGAVLDRPGAVRAMLANVGYVRKFAGDLDGDLI